MAKTTTEERPKRRFHLKRKLLLAAVLVVALAVSFFLGAVVTHQGTVPEITSDLISQQLSNIQELSTVEYYYTNMGRFENQLDFYGWAVPLTRKSFIISYDGVIKAGVDLSAVTVSVSGGQIIVTLPEAEIFSHEIPEDSIVIFDETHNIFNPITISDYTGFTQDQKAEVEAGVVENGLLAQANERACTAVERLLALMPGMDQYTLQVSTALGQHSQQENEP